MEANKVNKTFIGKKRERNNTEEISKPETQSLSNKKSKFKINKEKEKENQVLLNDIQENTISKSNKRKSKNSNLKNSNDYNSSNSKPHKLLRDENKTDLDKKQRRKQTLKRNSFLNVMDIDIDKDSDLKKSINGNKTEVKNNISKEKKQKKNVKESLEKSNAEPQTEGNSKSSRGKKKKIVDDSIDDYNNNNHKNKTKKVKDDSDKRNKIKKNKKIEDKPNILDSKYKVTGEKNLFMNNECATQIQDGIQFNLNFSENNNFNIPSEKVDKPDKEKTLLDFINDNKSGKQMKIGDKEKINNIQISRASKARSRKSSITLSCSNLSDLMVNNLERETYRFLKPKVIVESDGSIRIQKPNYSEIAQKIQDDNFKKNFPYAVHHNEKNKITSSSFRKLSHSDKWTEKETELFYHALELFGCNFSYLEIVLNPRTRDQIKKKFTREEKYNKEKIENSLKADKALNETDDKSNLIKFASILKKVIDDKKKTSMDKKRKLKYSKYANDSDITLSNYDNAEIYDFYNNKAESKIKHNETDIADNQKAKDGKKKNYESEYSKILIKDHGIEKNQFSKEKFNLLLNELEEHSNSSYESDDDSIQREKEKIKQYKTGYSTIDNNKFFEDNNPQNETIFEEAEKKIQKDISKEKIKEEKHLKNNTFKDDKPDKVEMTQQPFDFLNNFK